jgi:co-chaperonin GroES (HSP10)
MTPSEKSIFTFAFICNSQDNVHEIESNTKGNNPMLIPVGKRIIIRPNEVKNSTILLHNQKPSQFTVMAIGDEVTKVKPGNTIFLEKHYGVEIEYEGQKFLVIDESSILAKLD